MALVQFNPLVGPPYDWSYSASNLSDNNWKTNGLLSIGPVSGDSVLFLSPQGRQPNTYTSVIDAAYPANVQLAKLSLLPGVTLDVQQSITVLNSNGGGITGDSATNGSASASGLILVGNGATLTDAITPNQTLYVGGDHIGAVGTISISNNFSGPSTTLDVNGANLDLSSGQSDGFIELKNASFDSTDAASNGAVWTGGELDLNGNTVANLSSANYIDNFGDTNPSSPGPLVMSGQNNDVILPGDNNFTAASALTITNFGFTDTIELANTTFASADYFASTKGAFHTPDELDIFNSQGTLVVALQGVAIDPTTGLTGDIPSSDFKIGTNALGTYLELACFAAGTRIETRNGTVRVELLREGDEIVIYRGPDAELETAPAKWIGRRRVDLASHPAPSLVRPVRIEAGAFGPGVPANPLRLSPEHAVFFDGVLIPARHLINGSSVVQEEIAEVTYYHVELPHHDVLLAEGLPAESWLDTGNRSAFENDDGPVQLVPDFRPGAFSALSAEQIWTRKACAPLVESGPVVARLRGVLAARALELGLGCRAVQNIVLTANTEVGIAIPPGARVARLVSGITQASGDVRRLGASIQAILVDDRPIALDGPNVGPGFHEVEHDGERSWRWTDGDGLLFLDPAFSGKTLTVRVGACAAPRDIPIDPARAAAYSVAA